MGCEYSHMSALEREEIRRGLALGHSVRELPGGWGAVRLIMR